MNNVKQRILDVVRKPHLSSFATITETGKPWVRYVIATAAEDLTLRFATDKNTRKVAQIQRNPEVHMTSGGADPTTATEYVQIEGTAEFVIDQEMRDAFWHDELNKYFSGPDDPNYGIVVITPYRIELYTMEQYEPEIWKR
jgi:general stress protein 26